MAGRLRTGRATAAKGIVPDRTARDGIAAREEGIGRAPSIGWRPRRTPAGLKGRGRPPLLAPIARRTGAPTDPRADAAAPTSAAVPLARLVPTPARRTAARSAGASGRSTRTTPSPSSWRSRRSSRSRTGASAEQAFAARHTFDLARRRRQDL